MLSCSQTDITGYYAIPAAAGLVVYAVPDFGTNHTFVRLDNTRARSPDGSTVTTDATGLPLNYDYFDISFDTDQEMPVVFQDVTGRAATFQVAGGLCNRTLGTSTIRLTYQTCVDWSKDVVSTTYETDVDLPAQLFEAKLMEVTAVTDIGDMVPTYFNYEAVDVDLINDVAVGRWEYHPTPTIEVVFEGAPITGCSDVVVLDRDFHTNITISVTEQFWDEQAACDWIEGSVTITNKLGETPETAALLLSKGAVDENTATLLQSCYNGCELNLALSTSDGGLTFHSASASMELVTGEPEIVGTNVGVKYAKLFQASFVGEKGQAAERSWPVVVTGHKLISDLFSVVSVECMYRSRH
jgi:hypothetical protein